LEKSDKKFAQEEGIKIKKLNKNTAIYYVRNSAKQPFFDGSHSWL
jgi:hypothetical protein